MENRFLYRGKRIENGEWNGKWVAGHYYEFMGKSYIFEPPFTSGNLTYEVDPSTICQCTGLKDDDGTLIFENDVLSLKDEISKCEWKAIVKFGNPNAEYTWGWQLVPLTECDANKDILMWVETEMGYMYCNIIGNRFDNPEQLKGVSYDEK